MNLFKTTELGGLPLNLNDFRFIFGQDTYTGGIYQVLNSMLRRFGNNFIIYGCEVSGTDITAGLVMLDGELLFVDLHAFGANTHFAKVTTYHADGLKVFEDNTPPTGHDTYQKDRATVSAVVGTVAFATMPRLKGRGENYLNVTTITLTASKLITITPNNGNIYNIKSDGSTHVELSGIIDTSTKVEGEEIYIKIDSTSDPIIINVGTAAGEINGFKGLKCIATAGTIMKLIYSQGGVWYVKSASKALLTTPYKDAAGITTYKRTLTKIIELGDWNMDATTNVDVAHGLTGSKIIDVRTKIFRNAPSGGLSYNLESAIANDGVVDGVIIWDDTHIYNNRKTGGNFDIANFNSTSFNRGLIYIIYEE